MRRSIRGSATTPGATLKDAFAGGFVVGAALNPDSSPSIRRGAHSSKRQFNAITPENVLKWEQVHPPPGVYDFAPADQYVAFGERNRMFIVGHTLVWHNQMPRGCSRSGRASP